MNHIGDIDLLLYAMEHWEIKHIEAKNIDLQQGKNTSIHRIVDCLCILSKVRIY